MFRLLLAILFLIPTNGWCVTQWNVGIPTTGESKSAWPGEVHSQWSIIDTLLSNYKRNMVISYTSTTSLTVAAGECTVSNSGGSVRLFLQNAGNTAITSANLDSGASFSAGTTYYVYAATSSTTAASATFYISLSSSAPTGPTYYLQLGYFTTDGSGNITPNIINTNIPVTGLASWTSPSQGTNLQATTDLFCTAGFTTPTNAGNHAGDILTNSATPPTISRCHATRDGSTFIATSCSTVVKKADYYKTNINDFDFFYCIAMGN